MSKYLIGNFALPKYNTAASQALTRGGMVVNTAGTASMGGAASSGGIWEGLGAGAATALGSNDPMGDMARKYGLSIGGMNYSPTQK